jgi:hypothetical protein
MAWRIYVCIGCDVWEYGMIREALNGGHVCCGVHGRREDRERERERERETMDHPRQRKIKKENKTTKTKKMGRFLV